MKNPKTSRSSPGKHRSISVKASEPQNTTRGQLMLMCSTAIKPTLTFLHNHLPPSHTYTSDNTSGEKPKALCCVCGWQCGWTCFVECVAVECVAPLDDTDKESFLDARSLNGHVSIIPSDTVIMKTAMLLLALLGCAAFVAAEVRSLP